MRLSRSVFALTFIATMAMSGAASAYLICDPCCPKSPPKKEDDKMGREMALSYARAGQSFFAALESLENSQVGIAMEQLGSFMEHAERLESLLPEGDDTKSSVMGILDKQRSEFARLDQDELPPLELVIDAGTRWAEIQKIMNAAAAAKCAD